MLRPASSCLVAVLLSVFTLTHAAHEDVWRGRTIYQVLTDRFGLANGTQVAKCDPTLGVHCGGTWKGITEHLDYIQGMNFDAIWISPIVAQMSAWTGDGDAYAGYWQNDIYEINLSFGSEEDLRELIDEIHRRGMLLMLDVVVNHMAAQGPLEDLDYSKLRPFNDPKYYHSYCPNHYQWTELQNSQDCWLGSNETMLVDLDTESDEVRQMFALWIKNQIWKWGVDGLRIDAALNVPTDFFPDFMESADVFATSEVSAPDETLVCKWQDTIGSVLNYPLLWPLVYGFEGPDGNLQNLADMIQSQRNVCKDPTTLVTFSENHDTVRFKNYTTDLARAENVANFVILSDGIPVVYYGQEQHLEGGTEPYTNRQALWEVGYHEDATLYQLFAKLNLFRRHLARKYDQYTKALSDTIHIDSNSIAFARGADGDPKMVLVLNNKGEDAGDFNVELCDGHGYSANDELLEVNTCSTVKVGGNGCLEVAVSKGGPRAFFKKDALQGSTICDLPGKSDVGYEELTIISTTYTTTVSGTVSVGHSASTIPLASATVTSSPTPSGGSGGSGGNGGNGDTSSASRAMGPQHYSFFDLSLPTAFFIASFVTAVLAL